MTLKTGIVSLKMSALLVGMNRVYIILCSKIVIIVDMVGVFMALKNGPGVEQRMYQVTQI